MSRIFVAADWSGLESWLTAHLADDTVMMKELVDHRDGEGPKPHAVRAELLYHESHGVTVANCRTLLVPLQGQMKPAYDGGKRIGHLWNYGGEDGMIARTFWVDRPFAKRCKMLLDEKYPATTHWRDDLGNQVFGRSAYACPICSHRSEGVAGTCPHCSNNYRKVPLQWVEWITFPRREHSTVFGRRRLYLGVRREGVKPLAAQGPQSCGASMWYRTFMRLSGYEYVNGTREDWPMPSGLHGPVWVVWGTYDSFTVECEQGDEEKVAQWLSWTMEQAWPQLGGLRIPVELEVGWNFGSSGPTNPDGLSGVEYAALSAKRGDFV